MKKALIIANAVSMIHLFLESNIQLLLEEGYEVHLACNMEKNSKISPEQTQACIKDWERRGLYLHHFPVERSPFKKCNIDAYVVLRDLLKEHHFDLIHCHNPVVSVIVRLAASKYRKRGTKVLYTAHGFFFYKGGSKKDWMIYYPIEWFLSRFTDVLVTINKEDYNLAKRKFKKVPKIYYTNSVGIDYRRFAECNADRMEERKKYGLKETDKVLLSVGELYALKNHCVIIKAMAKIQDPDLHYVVAGTGGNRDDLIILAERLGLSERVHLIGYVQDIAALHRIADVFCHPSTREGLPIALAEAAASGLPAVVSTVRGNVDVINETNGFLCHYKDVNAFATAISKLINSEKLRKELSAKVQESAWAFDVSHISGQMREVYGFSKDETRKMVSVK